MFVTLLFQIIKQILTSNKDNLSECKMQLLKDNFFY